MRVGVLGPLVVTNGDAPVRLAGAKQQALVAMLALHAGQVVSTDRLIELLWGDDLPGGVANALQSRVSQLRRLLGRDRVVMRSNGYLLDIEPQDVDALAFATLVAEGRDALARGAVAEAAERLREGLGLWRGEALVDAGDDGFFQLEAARLGELRWSAIEDRVEADLALGRHQELAGEVVGLVEAQPLRERLRGQAMLALYRSGRQAEALATYQRAREAFAEELGIDPGPELQALELAILRQDPDLAPTPAVLVPGPPAAATGPRSPRLRRSLTSFVGRDRQVDAIRHRLRSDRLVTLTGPGGTGKTRLAVEVAADEQDGAPPRAEGDGTDAPGMGRPGTDVWVVELAPVADPASVPDAIAAALELPGERSVEGVEQSDALARVIGHLGDRPALVVLDNCEHLLLAVAAAAEWLLAQAPGLRVVATSREPLGVPGEVQWAVSPLATADAVRLFLDRAEAVRRDAAGDADEATVAEMCDRLDGLPLALELAAARVKALPVGEVAERLRDRFRLLTGGSRTALPRQQTLRALVDWSYELLFADERRTFCLLSVFAGRFSLDQAEELCELAGMDRLDVVDLVARLVDKSLVQVDAAGDGPARYGVLETLKEYGRVRLADDGGLDDARSWHATLIAARDDQAGPVLFTRGQVAAIRRLAAMHDDLDAALDWAIEARRADLALPLVDGLSWYWFVRGLWREGSTYVARAAALDAAPGPRARTLAWQAFWVHEIDVDLTTALDLSRKAAEVAAPTGDEHLAAVCDVQVGRSLEQLGRRDEARAVLVRAVATLDRLGDRFWSGCCRYLLGMSVLAEGRVDEAWADATRCLEDMRAIGERWGVLIGLLACAAVREAQGRGAEAVPLYQEALAQAGEINFEMAEAAVRVRLGGLLVALGDTAEARELCEECLALGRRVGDAHLTAYAAWPLGRLHRRGGDLDAAEALEREALAGMRTVGRSAVVDVLHELGYIAEARGDLAEARARHLEALGDDDVSVAATLEGLAGCAVAGGDAERAATLLAAAEAARERQGTVLAGGARADVERIDTAARAALGEERHAAAWAAGRRMAAPDALDLATAGDD